MIVVQGLSPNGAYLRLLALASQHVWLVEDSRVGPYRDLGAVTVELDHGERTIILANRGWNPAFALVEAAWVLTGRNDVKTLAEFIGNFNQYSDDGLKLHGAYGNRLRHYFELDQIEAAINEFTKNPASRRVVMSLYAASDLGLDSKDIPCNTHVALRLVAGRLEMTVSNRSNDLWLGVPYNWFVFRILQHFIANRLGVECGIQRHVSSCLHLYERDITAATRVVATNREADLNREESELASLNVPDMIRDATSLADLSFDALTSPQLTEFFTHFKIYRNGKAVPSDLPVASNILTASMNRWIVERHSMKASTVNQPLTYNGETEVGLLIQKWAIATPIPVVIEKLSVITEKALPMLREALRSDLGQGLRVEFEDAASERRAAIQFVLELIFGTLDPELVRTMIGDRLRERLTEIAIAMGFQPSPFRVRELSDERLNYLFGDLLP